VNLSKTMFNVPAPRDQYKWVNKKTIF